MPRGYVRSGKNADPEFNKRRAQQAAAARENIDRLVRRVVSRSGELTPELRAMLAAAL